MTGDDLLLNYVQRAITIRALPEPPTDQQAAMSEGLVGLIATGIIWTFIFTMYALG